MDELKSKKSVKRWTNTIYLLIKYNITWELSAIKILSSHYFYLANQFFSYNQVQIGSKNSKNSENVLGFLNGIIHE